MDENKKPVMTLERAMELLDHVIDYMAIGENTSSQLETLFKIGFTADELIQCFHYSESDVKAALEDAGTDDEEADDD